MALNTHSLDLEVDSSQYASIADGSQTGLDLSGDCTFEFGIKFETLPSSGNAMQLFSKSTSSGNQRAYDVTLYNDGGTLKVQAGISDDGSNRDLVRINWTPSTGTWYHFAITIDVSAAVASEFELFIDGVSQGNGSTVLNDSATSIYNSSAAFMVGGINAGASGADFKIDEFRVWSDIRTQPEIDNNKAIHLDGDEAALVSCWRFNNDYTDLHSNGNDLTASGSPVFSTDTLFAGTTDATDSSIDSSIFFGTNF